MIKYGGVGIIYMDGHIFFPLRGGKQIHDNSFLICLFIIRLLHSIVLMEFHAVVVAFVVLGFTNAN